MGNKKTDLLNGALIPCHTRGPKLQAFTRKCYMRLFTIERHIQNYLESKTRGVQSKDKQTMKRLYRLVLSNVQKGYGYQKYVTDVALAHVENRHENFDKYGNRYHGRQAAKEMVRIAGKVMVDELRAELNTHLRSTRDKPYGGFSLDVISAQ